MHGDHFVQVRLEPRHRRGLRHVFPAGGIGLVAVSTPATGRARPVELTDAGREALGEAERAVLAVERRMLGEISATERKTLVTR